MVDQLKIVVSDFHLGKGDFHPNGLPNTMEDFHQDERFRELLLFYSRGEGRDGAKDVELVINGDFLDYLAVDVNGRFIDAMFEADAVAATQAICAGHPEVIEGLREFGRTEGCRIRYQMGNHDPAVVWPEVQESLRNILGVPIQFGFDDYSFDDVRIEHGHQREVIHQFDQQQLILPPGVLNRPAPILNMPFGCFFVTQFVNDLRMRRHYIGQVVPFRLYLRWAFINDFWFALWNGIRVAAFFIKMRFIRHPTRFSRFSKTLKILRDTFTPPRLEVVARNLLERESFRILVMGHNHEAMLRLYPDGKQYVNSGTWTEFTSFDPEMLGRHVVLSYVVLTKDKDQPWRVDLMQWHGATKITERLRW